MIQPQLFPIPQQDKVEICKRKIVRISLGTTRKSNNKKDIRVVFHWVCQRKQIKGRALENLLICTKLMYLLQLR